MLTQDLSDSECDEIEMLTQDVYYDSECDQVVTLDEYCDSECEEMVTLDVYCESDIQCGVYDNNSCIANSDGTLVTQDEYIASSDDAVNKGNSNVDPFRCDTVYEDISCRNVNSIKVNNSTVKPSKMSKEFDISKPTDAKLIEKLSDIELSYLIQQYTVTAVNTVSDNPDPDLFPFGVWGGAKKKGKNWLNLFDMRKLVYYQVMHNLDVTSNIYFICCKKMRGGK